MTTTQIRPRSTFSRTIDRRTVAVPDRFDVHQVEAFEADLRACPGDVVLDLGAVRFVDGAGMRALVRARADALLAGNEVSVGLISTAARVTLELAGLAEALPSAADQDEVA